MSASSRCALFSLLTFILYYFPSIACFGRLVSLSRFLKMNVVELEVVPGPDGKKLLKPKNPDALKERGMTVPYDPRFPNTNQTKNCYQNYLDFFRCQKVKGEDYEPCGWYKYAYTELCPPGWIEKWNEQREKGIFPGRI